MSTVVMHNVVTVDGFIADDHDQIGPLFDWYFNGDTPLTEGGRFRSPGPRPTTSGLPGRRSARW